MRYEESYQYKITGKVLVLCISDFKFLERRWEDERF
jgi:hypothetical protein